MAIEFGPDRWERIRRNYGQWWTRELERPLVVTTVANRDPGRPCPSAPVLCQATCADFSVSVDDLVDRLDWELSKVTFYGDSYPSVNLHSFGPGVMAAFCGAVLDNSTGGVWFHPKDPDMPIQDLHLEYDPDNKWLNRIKDFCAAAMRRWQGQVLVTMTDIGGNLDVLSSFRPGEQLLMDLYDEPDEVKRLIWEEHELWHRFYNEINDMLQPVNPGYSDWLGVYSATPSYVLQCDFCYMIGPEMFKEFALPEIEATTRRLDHTIYHLDGKGQLPHLDMLLALPELNGIQWQPGDGAPQQAEWPEVRRRIAAAGKNMQSHGSASDLRAIIEQAGTSRGIHHNLWAGSDQSDAALRRLVAEFGAE